MVAFQLNGQKLTCANFKNGTFIVPKMSENIPEHKLVRNGNSQEEIIQVNGQTIKIYGNITWINECSYKLTYDLTKMKPSKEIQFINDNGGIITELIKIEDNCFYYKSFLLVNGKEFKRIDGKYCKK
jgi:hypothetical protein